MKASRRWWLLSTLFGASFALVAASSMLGACGGSENTPAGNDGGKLDATTADADAAPDTSVEAAADGPTDAGSDAPPVIPLDSGTYGASATWGPAAAIAPPNYPGGVWGGQTLTFNGSGGLVKIENPSWNLSTTGPLAETYADGLVAWGRWVDGTTTMNGPTTNLVALNYVAGVPIPSSGTAKASYTVFGSTAPTAVSGGPLVVGTPNQVTGTITVSGSTITFSLSNIKIAGHTYAITGSTGFYATSAMLGGGTVTGSNGCDAGCAGNITNAGATQGWFFGAAGERAAMNYGFTSTLGNVSGAVVFK